MERIHRRRSCKSWGDEKLTATGLGAYIAKATEAGDFPRVVLGITVMCIFGDAVQPAALEAIVCLRRAPPSPGLMRTTAMLDDALNSSSTSATSHCSFPKGSGDDLLVLENVDLTIIPVKSSGLLGRPAPGKSTLLRIIAGPGYAVIRSGVLPRRGHQRTAAWRVHGVFNRSRCSHG